MKAIKRQKTKQIVKQEKIPPKQSKGRKGRPAKTAKNQTQVVPSGEDQSFQIDSEYNSVDLIKNAHLDYMGHIGYSRGLVFTQDVRKKLREQRDRQVGNVKIAWDQVHQWKEEEEIIKIQKNIQVLFDEKILPNEDERKQLIQIFLDIGDIYPRQITNEVYKILTNLIIISSKVQLKQKTRQIPELLLDYINEVCENGEEYIFLTGKFSQIDRFRTSVQIKPHLTTLFKVSIMNLKEIVRNGKVTRF